jgi:hypothetical protein
VLLADNRTVVRLARFTSQIKTADRAALAISSTIVLELTFIYSTKAARAGAAKGLDNPPLNRDRIHIRPGRVTIEVAPACSG